MESLVRVPLPEPRPDEGPPAVDTPAALLEVLDRDGQVRSAHAVRTWPLTVGRALDNDVVLSDPHVAAHLLRIRPGPGGLVADVGVTVNGVQVGSRRLAGGAPHPLAIGAAPIELTAGRTRLRLRLPEHALAPELPLAAASTAVPRAGLTLGLALTLAAGVSFGTWLDNDPDNLGRALATTLLTGVVGAAVWSGLWALLSKTFTRQGHFGWHLRVFLLASLAWLALGVLPALFAFMFDRPWLTDFAFVGTGAVGATALYFHLLAVEPARPRLLRRAALTAALVGIALTLWFNLQRTDRFGEELYMSHLFPPALRLARPVPVDAFVNGLLPLQAELDKKAKEPPRGADTAPARGNDDDE
ncbi:MAG: FHA domain-containing protein [Burkholderiaceae bacterium]